MEKSVQKMDFLLLISWMKRISSTDWENPTAVSIREDFIYTSNCTDDPEHTEDKHSLYGAT